MLEEEQYHTCPKCKTSYPLNSNFFDRNKASPTGFHWYCRSCRSKYRKEHETKENPKSWYAARKANMRNRYSRGGHKERHLFLLTEPPAMPQICPVFGTPLHYSVRSLDKYSAASIDRINTTKPYTDDNVVIMSWRANELKRDASLSELVKLGRWAQGMIDLGYS